MSQYRKQNNGFLPSGAEQEKTLERKPATSGVEEAAKRLKQMGEFGKVEIRPDIINGQPGLRIKIPFE